ncbi:SUMF1/EgtB/PvdO family nonheme iron enzyme [Treponema vincentii]|uniref:SUMF1/EgtB/PvdO family nonheme iron enzyme n=1 Tax=Treponema vincentii TaxID=69710 RepID=UPI0020A2B814|nr:SUMF1/EgtB/PvdO family nonheme iron enzyme [Treponema vincentii]UTC59115.1 SUMF1/EgtB/PvdO family nonheme iron enzyme [Treponema vincentii]
MKTTHSWNKSVRLLRWLAGALLLTAFTVSCKANVSTPIAVSGVTLDKATVTLVEQETVTLKATVKPANATNKAVTWSSNKPDVAAVDKDGKVTAHKAGEAVITVKSEDGAKTASCTVRVTAKASPIPTYAVTFSVDGTGGTLKAKAEGIAETETSPITIEQGKTVTFTAKPADGYEVEKWTVNGTTVANNVSTTYSHKVTTAVMVKVSFKALPPPAVAVTGVTLDKPTVSLVAGTSTTLTATVLPANATNKTVTWSSDKPAIASVDKNGTVTAHKAGEAVITVKSEDGAKTASCTVTVSLTEYVITYHLDGGSNHADNPAKYTVETETITLKDASKANYTFAGWYEKADFTGEKVTQIVKGSSGNKELWAKFLENYTITYNLNGGSNHADNPANYTVETETITLKDASKANYTFAGWYANAGFTGEKVTQIGKGSTGNKELWAKFLENYSITYHLDGGSNHADNPAKYTIETETITLKPAEKADHIFFGWYASADFSGEKVTEIRKGSSGNKELYAKFIEMKMIDIAAVTNGTLGHANYGDNGEHTVSLTAYRIGETEVTQELWQAVMGNNPSMFDSSPESGEVQGKRPVEGVNWYKCIAFCNELTKKVPELGESQCVYTVDGHTYGTADATAGKKPTMDMNKKGFRLPTEAEWEWAAMGGKDYKWSGTNVESELVNYAWYGANSSGKTHEVKQKQPNGYGLYDMSGNVWEWCWDWYGTLLNPLPEDYLGAVSGSRRVFRGGSWGYVASFAARAFRGGNFPDRSYDYLGFRVACRP